MCTVTLVPLVNKEFVLISNRDEAPNRKSLPPEFYNHEDEHLLFPKDVLSGGTWIGLSEQKRLVCLLNGGFEIHERKADYRHSRGIVVKDLLVCNSIIDAVEQYDLLDIEPFTLVIVEWQEDLKFFELVWDGSTKHFSKLKNEPHIWSSSTLYNEHMRLQRQKWFDDYKAKNVLDPDSMLAFHEKAGIGNKEYDVIMDRGFVKTTSITRVVKENDDIVMNYYDIDSNSHHNKYLSESPLVHD